MVIGVNRLLNGEAIAPQQLNRPVGDYLVNVHVAARSRSSLKDIDGELVGQLASGDLLGGSQKCGNLLGIEPVLAGFFQLPQVAVGDPAGVLHQPHRPNQLRGQTPAGDGKILHGPLGLRAVIGIRRDGHFTHGIALDAHFRPGRRTGH